MRPRLVISKQASIEITARSGIAARATSRSIAHPVIFNSTSNLRRSLCELLALLRLGGALGRYSQLINRRILLTEGRMTSGATTASSGSLGGSEPRSATHSLQPYGSQTIS